MWKVIENALKTHGFEYCNSQQHSAEQGIDAGLVHLGETMQEESACTDRGKTAEAAMRSDP